jgi:hypothetical protein
MPATSAGMTDQHSLPLVLLPRQPRRVQMADRARDGAKIVLGERPASRKIAPIPAD